MASEMRYNPVVLSRLVTLCGCKDWEAVVRYLQGLSHGAFRAAGLVLEKRVLPNMAEDDYWAVVLRLTEYHAKALLGTLLKSAVERIRSGTLSLQHEGFKTWACRLNAPGGEVDRRKTLLALIPALQEHADIELLLEALHVGAPRERLPYLLKGDTVPCYFLLFRTLHFLEHDKPLLVDCCRFLMKKGDSLSFNLASLVKLYFDLPQVNGTFSLRFQPYELGRLEASFDTFSKALTRM